MRTHYKIRIEFTYKNGELGGILETTVNSRRAVDIQLKADYAWLAIKGHAPTKEEITPVEKRGH